MIWNKQNVLDALQNIIKKDFADNFLASGFSIDSRTITKQQIFIAIKGKNFDGHDFIKQAEENGAVAVIAHKIINISIKIPTLFVIDTMLALHSLAKFFIKKIKPKIIAVTGSCGKTTTKDMLQKLISKFGNTASTIGNFNNNIGMPLSILAANQDTKFLVLEMGMSNKGEIASLVKIAKPDIAIITNISTNHIANFKSVFEIAKAKAEIFTNTDSKVVINADTQFAYFLIESARRNGNLVTTYGLSKDSDLKILHYQNQKIALKIKSEIYNYRMPDFGMHFALNSACAVSALHVLGIKFTEEALTKAFSDFCPASGRMLHHNIKILDKELLLVDDCYNAGYDSINALSYHLKSLARFTVVILGHLAEVGDFAGALYSKIERSLSFADLVITVHPCSAKFKNAKRYSSLEFLKRDLPSIFNSLPQNAVVAVKGSRESNLDKIIKCILDMRHQ